MTKEEARKLLEGTWSFAATGKGVMVRESGLLQEIELLMQAARPVAPVRSHHSPRSKAVPVFAASG